MLMNDEAILGSEDIFQESFGYKKRLSDTSMNEIIQIAMNFIAYKKSSS